MPGLQPRIPCAPGRLARLVDVASPNLFTMVCIAIGGSLEIAGGNGLYWVAAAEILALCGGVTIAWLFLTR